jgi:hypothetical protein
MDKAQEMKDKAEQALGSEGADEKVDAAAEKAKKATGNKHDEHVDKAADMAKDRLGDKNE